MTYDFPRIREHYRRFSAQIDAGAADPYAWCEAGIELTPIEFGLWQDIRMEGAVFYPQYPVGRFFVDFGNPLAKVAIECDGARWHTDKARDAARQAEIEQHGWTVYRIAGRDCLTDTTEAEDEIGRPVVRVGAARLFVRDICRRHRVQPGGPAA